MLVVPDRSETSLPVPKQSFSIGAARVETSTRTTRKAAEECAIVHVMFCGQNIVFWTIEYNLVSRKPDTQGLGLRLGPSSTLGCHLEAPP